MILGLLALCVLGCVALLGLMLLPFIIEFAMRLASLLITLWICLWILHHAC